MALRLSLSPAVSVPNPTEDDVFLLTAGAQFHDRTAHYP